jgi:uncharacterized protein (TIGR02996 family)
MFAHFTEEERGFIRSILNNPAELTGWTAYVDWLEERDQLDRAEYLRLELKRLNYAESDPQRHAIRARMEELSTTLNPDWIAIFDRGPIENCVGPSNFKCPRRWERLHGTDRPTVRRCGVCEKDVHFCRDIETARGHVELGECVVVRSGTPRTALDLSVDPLEVEAWSCLLDDDRLGLTKDNERNT